MATEATKKLLEFLGYDSVQAIISTGDGWIANADEIMLDIADICVHPDGVGENECGHMHARGVSWEYRSVVNDALRKAEVLTQLGMAKLKLAEMVRDAGGVFTYGVND